MAAGTNGSGEEARGNEMPQAVFRVWLSQVTRTKPAFTVPAGSATPDKAIFYRTSSIFAVCTDRLPAMMR